MSSIQNHAWLLVRRPQGEPTLDCFKWVESDPPKASDGQVLGQYSNGQAKTMGQVVLVMKSSACAGGRLRLSSVKNENMPPPNAAAGKALRAAA